MGLAIGTGTAKLGPMGEVSYPAAAALAMSDNRGCQPFEGTPFLADQILRVKFNIDGNVPFDFCIDEIRLF